MSCLYRSRHLAQLLIGNLHLKETPKRHSALFINGTKAVETYTYVNPHIDWPERIRNEERLCRDLQRRKIHVDLEELKSIWQFYNNMLENKTALEIKKAAITAMLTDLMKSNENPQAIDKLKIHVNLIKENLKALKSSFWYIEENAIVRALKLPNALHDRSPAELNIIYSYLEKPESGGNHLDVGKALGLIIYDSNKNYYLQGDAAVFELGSKFYFSNFLKEHDFVQFSNPDFVKSVVIEGCGSEHTDPDHSFILHHFEDTKVNIDSRMHLVGGASLHSFFAYYTKNVLNQNYFPLRYFTMGRKYVPSKSTSTGLFNINQSSAIEIFVMTEEPHQMDQTLDEIIEMCKSLYSTLGYHFRLSYAPSDTLLQWESLRLSIEMFSFSLGRYVEVGNVSLSGDYISKRLLLTYRESKQTKFPCIVSGTLMNVQRLLACILEQDQEFRLPKQFEVNNWAMS